MATYGYTVRKQIIPYLSPSIKKLLQDIGDEELSRLEEIRLRYGQPMILKLGDKDFGIDKNGKLNSLIQKTYLVNEDDIIRTIASVSDNSIYAFEEDIRRGFITIPGGHRVGLAGQVLYQENAIRTIKDFSGVCFRIARQVIDCAASLISIIDSTSVRTENALVISPPRCGKTTILRDIVRLLSNGTPNSAPRNVVLIDERSEIAGSYRGIPQLDIGMRTDVLDSCPKAMGMIMAIRSLSPQVIVTDEIGRKEDIEAIQECIYSGVTIISSIHASSVEELHNRPLTKDLLQMKAFKIGIILSRREGPGTIEDIVRWD